MALEAGQKLVNQEFIREPMGPYDVYMDVINCGICHTDIHLLNGDWGPMSAFPKPQVSYILSISEIYLVYDGISLSFSQNIDLFY